MIVLLTGVSCTGKTALAQKLLEKYNYPRYAIGILIAFVVIISFLLPYWVDDFACAKYHNKIESVVSGVDEIKVIDVLSGCGNPANGKHTSKIVAVLIETQMTDADLADEFSDAFSIIPFNELLKETKTFNRFSKHIIGNGKNNYVIVYSESAPFYYLDLRGH